MTYCENLQLACAIKTKGAASFHITGEYFVGRIFKLLVEINFPMTVPAFCYRIYNHARFAI